jgi:outer membrane biosynthesis protein TonB
MLFYQPKNKHSFLWYFCVICGFHIVFLVLLFFKRSTNALHISFNTQSTMADIIFIPSTSTKPQIHSSQITSIENEQKKIIIPSSACCAVIAPASSQKKEQPKSALKKSLPKKAPIQKEKSVSKKILPEKEIKKSEEKRIEKDKKEPAKLQELSKKDQINPRVQEIQPKGMATQEIKQEIKMNSSLIEQKENASSSIVYATPQEIEAYERTQFLQQKVSEVWKPPRGLAQGLQCFVACDVNSQGKAQNITIEKTSTILMFDIAAKKAINLLEFPLWTRGSHIIITFKS